MPFRPFSYKYWLSFLFDLPQAQAQSALSGALTLLWRDGRYMLCSPDSVYSFEDRYDNFEAIFRHLQAGQRPWKRVLVLGAGMGSIPLLLEKQGLSQAFYDLVELDPVICQWAKTYSLPELKSPYALHLANALDFPDTAQAPYDLICLDVFVGEAIPADLLQAAYLNKLKGLLGPQACLLINCLYHKPEAQAHTQAFFEGVFKAVFPQGQYFDTRHNRMIYAIN